MHFRKPIEEKDGKFCTSVNAYRINMKKLNKKLKILRIQNGEDFNVSLEEICTIVFPENLKFFISANGEIKLEKPDGKNTEQSFDLLLNILNKVFP